jgi:hypothetical protein
MYINHSVNQPTVTKIVKIALLLSFVNTYSIFLKSFLTVFLK